MSRNLKALLRYVTVMMAVVSIAISITILAGNVGAEPTRAEKWQAVAQSALDQLNVLDTGGAQQTTVLAYAAQATARLSPDGWDDPAALAFLTRMYATQNPDGGYGLGYAYDAHQDGTLNPPATTYTVTLAGYVGPVMLSAYRAGKVAQPLMQQVFNLVATAPRIDTAAGRCIAYSLNANDVKTGLCVHNVNAGAAAFLLDAGRDGFAVPWWLIQGIVKRELSVYNQNTRFWPYKDVPSAQQDAVHNAYSIESMYELAYPVAYSAAYVALNAAPDGNQNTPLVYAMLTGLPSSPTAMSGATTVWCVLGDQWVDEVETFVNSNQGDIGRLSQAAYYASRAALACA